MPGAVRAVAPASPMRETGVWRCAWLTAAMLLSAAWMPPTAAATDEKPVAPPAATETPSAAPTASADTEKPAAPATSSEATEKAAAPAASEDKEKPAASAFSRKGADTCLGCHDDPRLLGIFRTKHGRPTDPRSPFGHGQYQCEACHGPGGAHVKAKGNQPAGIVHFNHDGVTSAVDQNSKCLGCHEANTAHDWGTTAHAAAGIACADCHRIHTAQDPIRRVADQPDVCGNCHEGQRSNLLKPSHHPLREGKMACTSCHAVHGAKGPASLMRASVTETCTVCHAEYRGPFLWEHQPVAEACTNCHEPHGSIQNALLKSRPPFLCQQCHEGQGHPSAPNTPAGLPSGMPSVYLLAGGCVNCHSQVHGSNHPSGRAFMR
jgi:DmsE family decaheme c-type cytochrome